ncbi:hypothetical protein B0H10DRAFT_2029626 [Mycena sp. CBHHK59/15]|nr:hypothetical protein B0H10DRAFT_2029626 [Mycena sp. CBHHK59/15]
MEMHGRAAGKNREETHLLSVPPQRNRDDPRCIARWSSGKSRVVSFGEHTRHSAEPSHPAEITAVFLVPHFVTCHIVILPVARPLPSLVRC